MSGQIQIENKTKTVRAYLGGSVILKPGTNDIAIDDWEKIKSLEPVKKLVDDGDYVPVETKPAELKTKSKKRRLGRASTSDADETEAGGDTD